jgi:transposase
MTDYFDLTQRAFEIYNVLEKKEHLSQMQIQRLQRQMDCVILAFLQQPHTYDYITHTCHVSRSRVVAVKRKGSPLEHKMGRTKKVTPEIVKQVLAMTVEHPHMSYEEIAKAVSTLSGVPIGRSTVQRIKKGTLIYGAARRIPLLTDQQIGARLQFVEDYLYGEGFSDIRARPVIYSDESRFSSQSDRGGVWRLRGHYPYNAFAPTEKFSKINVMIWGAVAKGYKSELVIVVGKENAAKYRNFLTPFFQHADEKFGQGRWAFMQDGASPHTTKQTTEYVTQHCHLLPSWPANSPDLNPIEMVWAELKRQIDWSKIAHHAAAVAEIQRLWEAFPQDHIDKLVSDFENRLFMTRAAEGRTIQPLVSSHHTTVPDGYMAGAPPVDNPEQYRWDSQRDEQLAQLTAQGLKAKEIAAIMNKHHLDVKHRMRYQLIIALNDSQWGPDPLVFERMIEEALDWFRDEEQTAQQQDPLPNRSWNFDFDEEDDFLLGMDFLNETSSVSQSLGISNLDEPGLN